MTAHTERDLVCQLAVHDSQRAYERAVAIAGPLFRAQALAWVARYAPTSDVRRIVGESLAVAATAEDAYRQVAASAWPIRALVERELVREAKDAVTITLKRAISIENPVSRVDALFLVWQAGFPLGASSRARILTPLLAAALSADSWKPQRILQSIVFMLSGSEHALAEHIVDRMPAGKYKRAAGRRLAAGEREDPRPFFWGDAA